MPARGINFLPMLLLAGGFAIGLLIGILRRRRNKWNWLRFGLLGFAAGILLLLLLGLIDRLLSL